jgi:hypothetical protein
MPNTLKNCLRKNCLRTSIAAVVAMSLAGNAYAASCASPEERMAIRAAAIQQRLMVAAYMCNAAPQYNKFVLAYRDDLQQSDALLKDFFNRAGGKKDAAYHAFKTRLANMSSLDSSHDGQRFCGETRALFDSAFAVRKTDLTVFLDGKQTKWERDFPACKNPTVVARDR